MNDTMENGTDSSSPVTPITDIYYDPSIYGNFSFIPYISYKLQEPFIITDLAISFVLVLPSNIYALWLMLSGAGGTIAFEFFYLNLTASVIVSTLSSVFRFAWFFTLNFIWQTVSYFTLILFFWFSVPSFQCCICVERYIAVVHPVVFLRYKALRYRVACCCVVWLMVLAFSLFYVWLPTVMCYIFLGFCIVCISVLCFCCLSVLRALKQPGPGEGQRDGDMNDMKRKAFRIILICLVVKVVTIIIFIPNILSVLTYYTGEFQFSPVALLTIYTLSKLAGCVHPLLYIHKAGKLPCFK